MSKLWKQEWKYHMFFIIVTTLIPFFVCHSGLEEEYRELFIRQAREGLQGWEVLQRCEWLMGSVHYCFFNDIIIIVLVSVLIKKAMIYWIEQARYGREFIQSLPIRKVNRVQYHLLMDLLQIVVPLLIYGIYDYLQIDVFLKDAAKIYLPWLFGSFCGMMVIVISYMIMLMGVLYIMECIFVSGSAKMIGFIGTCIMAVTSLNCLFNQLYANKLMQNVMGFFTMESVGGAQYNLTTSSRFGVDNMYTWEYGYNSWYYEHMNPPMQYMGEWVDYDSIGTTAAEFKLWLSALNRSFTFSNVSSYIFYVICYLVIGFALIAVAMWLTNKRELSKDVFYFGFGRYLMSGMIALTLLFMITDWHGKVGLILLDLAAALIVFFILLYLLDSNRQKSFSKKADCKSRATTS